MATINKDPFSFWVPAELTKGKNKDGIEEMLIEGIASSAVEDSDGESLQPYGFDYAPFMATGLLNWDHQAKKTSAAIVGEPIDAKIVNGGKEFWIKGKLYSDSDEARSIWKLAKIFEKNSTTRRLGFSIEGNVIERGCGPEFFDKEKTLRNPEYTTVLWNKIIKAQITGCAITPCPKNPNTFMNIVKGQFSGLMDNEFDEDIEKAITAAGFSDEGVIAEDVEGGKNPNKIPLKDPCDHKMVDGKCSKCGTVGLYVKKSEIYNLIADRYTTDIVKARQIYTLITDVNQKLFNMSKETGVSREAINKSFAFLDEAVNLQKSKSDEKEEGKEDDKEEKTKPEGEAPDEKDEPSEEEVKKAKDEEMEKAKDECYGLMKAGKNRKEIEDELQKSGYSPEVATSAVSSIISSAESLKENGGQVTAGSFAKSQDVEIGKDQLGKVETVADNSLLKSLTEQTDLIKSMNDGITARFGALGNVLKYSVEQNELLKGQIETLQKSNTTLNERLGTVENQSQGRKSVTTSRQIEKFDKSNDTTIDNSDGKTLDLSKSKDVERLSDILFADAKNARQSGNPSAMLEGAVSMLEISKSLLPEALGHIQGKGYRVVRSGQ